MEYKHTHENTLHFAVTTDDLISSIVTDEKRGTFDKKNRRHVSALRDISMALDRIGAWEWMCKIMKEDADLNCPPTKAIGQNWIELCAKEEP